MTVILIQLISLSVSLLVSIVYRNSPTLMKQLSQISFSTLTCCYLDLTSNVCFNVFLCLSPYLSPSPQTSAPPPVSWPPSSTLPAQSSTTSFWVGNPAEGAADSHPLAHPHYQGADHRLCPRVRAPRPGSAAARCPPTVLDLQGALEEARGRPGVLTSGYIEGI